MNHEADVVIVGYGAAGACAALEAAAAGADVLVIERFTGGGATALSGGVVYAGGGTRWQRDAGVTDSPDAMRRYLETETGDAVTPATLRAFCDGSADMLDWLAGHGVPFRGSLCPDKTSYPTNRYYLYYSGSERSMAAVAPPAPRGHRAVGRGTSGKVLFARLAGAVRAVGSAPGEPVAGGAPGGAEAGGAEADGAAGAPGGAAAEVAAASGPDKAGSAGPDGRTAGRIRVLTQTRAVRLATDAAGRVTAVDCLTLRGAVPGAPLAHRMLHRWSAKPYLYAPKIGRAMHRPASWLERRFARPVQVTARRGVVLAAGGFAANKSMLREHAPYCRGGLPLATPGDDGAGIWLGVQAGGATRFLDRASVWRFISPPPALLRGILVSAAGERVLDESRYGAAIGDAIVRRHGGRAWLLADHAVIAAARRELRGSTLWFQRLQAWYLLSTGRVSGPTPDAAAARAGVDPAGLATTLAAYNKAAAAGEPDQAGKPADLVTVLDQPPYSLIDLSVRPRLGYPAPVLTLGGLVVSELTGQVLRPDGSPVAGLFATGRTAVGLCSSSYVSGLSLADCVFSGRRAGRHAATPQS